MLPFLVPLALKLSPVGRILKSIPRQVWIALAVVAILALGTCAHKRSVKKFGEEQYAAGVKAERDRAAKAVKKAETAGNAISKEIRSKSDEEARRINTSADARRVRGPGLARCAVPSAAASESKPASGNGDASRLEVPARDSAAVPWPWLVDRAEQADLNRAEVLAWREWHQRLSEEWAKYRVDADAGR